MKFRNRSSIIAACMACVASAASAIGSAIGFEKAPEPFDPSAGRKHHSRPRRPTRRQRIKEAFKRRRRELGFRMTLNRACWLRCVQQGHDEKAYMIANQKGKHGPWRFDGRMQRRGKVVTL
jgi:hypothetical protein